MKETSGEFSMTVVVIIGAIILVGILNLLMPRMSNFIERKWQTMVNNAKGPTGVIVAPFESELLR